MSRISRLAHQAPAVLVLGLLGVGIALTRPPDYRPGLYVVGGACLLGALLRLVLPALRVGLLAVRGRATDVVTLTLLGAAIITLATVVPRAR